MEINIISDSDKLRFESIWVDEIVKKNFSASRLLLDDDDRISFKIWENLYYKEMYAKYIPNRIVFRGDNPNIIFHGGCIGCKSQRIHGIDRCKGCSYFGPRQGKYENLFIPGEDNSTMTGEDFKNIFR